MKERIKNQSILQIGHHVAYGLVMLYNSLKASYLKRLKCEYCKENTKC